MTIMLKQLQKLISSSVLPLFQNICISSYVFGRLDSFNILYFECSTNLIQSQNFIYFETEKVITKPPNKTTIATVYEITLPTFLYLFMVTTESINLMSSLSKNLFPTVASCHNILFGPSVLLTEVSARASCN